MYAKSKSTKVSENADLIKMQTSSRCCTYVSYVQQGKIIDNQFFIGCHNVKKVFFSYYIFSMQPWPRELLQWSQ